MYTTSPDQAEMQCQTEDENNSKAKVRASVSMEGTTSETEHQIVPMQNEEARTSEAIPVPERQDLSQKEYNQGGEWPEALDFPASSSKMQRVSAVGVDWTGRQLPHACLPGAVTLAEEGGSSSVTTLQEVTELSLLNLQDENMQWVCPSKTDAQKISDQDESQLMQKHNSMQTRTFESTTPTEVTTSPATTVYHDQESHMITLNTAFERYKGAVCDVSPAGALELATLPKDHHLSRCNPPNFQGIPFSLGHDLPREMTESRHVFHNTCATILDGATAMGPVCSPSGAPQDDHFMMTSGTPMDSRFNSRLSSSVLSVPVTYPPTPDMNVICWPPRAPIVNQGQSLSNSDVQRWQSVASTAINQENIHFVEVEVVHEKVVHKPVIIKQEQFVEKKVPQIVWEEKDIEVPQIQYKEVPKYIDEIEWKIVERKKKEIQPIYREVVINKPKIVVVPKLVTNKIPEYTQRDANKPRLHEETSSKVRDIKKPTVVAQVLRPIVTDSDDKAEIPLKEYVPELISVRIPVPKPIPMEIWLGGIISVVHKQTSVGPAHWNSLVKAANPRIANPEFLPYMRHDATGHIPFLPSHEHIEIVTPVSDEWQAHSWDHVIIPDGYCIKSLEVLLSDLTQKQDTENQMTNRIQSVPKKTIETLPVMLSEAKATCPSLHLDVVSTATHSLATFGQSTAQTLRPAGTPQQYHTFNCATSSEAPPETEQALATTFGPTNFDTMNTSAHKELTWYKGFAFKGDTASAAQPSVNDSASARRALTMLLSDLKPGSVH